ncbi:MAG: hypothetical protein JWO56_3544, partial [Acidobacteria bacterium]|nr:hypothetical protein [Acidobacteriota bacterium]
SFLAWFAQRLAFQTSSDLVVMGHTHVAVRGLKISPVRYVNSGYFCVSKPDMRTTPVTFTVVDIPNASAQLVKVVKGARGPEVENVASGEAPLLPVIPSIGEDYSCYLRVRNRTGGSLSLAGSSKRTGYWTVPPPKSIADGARVDIWLQDELGTDGAQGAFTYTDAISAKALAFGFRCPTPHKGRNAVTSPVPNWETKVSDGGWRKRDTAWLGHPLQVRFDVGAPTPTGTNGGLPGTAVTVLATRPRSDCHEPPDPKRTPVGHQQQAAEHADYIAIGERILAKCKVSAERGKVISHVYLRSSTSAPLIDTRTEPGAVPRRVRLSNPPKHVMNGEVFEIYDETYGPFRYILIQPNGPAPPPAIGGFLFLPSEGSRNLHLVTFNVAKLDVSYKSQCRHDHHAEMQVVRWVNEQPLDWRARIGWLTIQNSSRKRDLAYSPCNACCHELASFLTSVKSVPRRSSDVLARLSWGDIYEGAAKCGHPTTMSGIDMLKKAGWELPEHPMPPGVSMVGGGIATADDPRWPARVLSTR